MIRRILGADALPLFSATACVLASAPTWLPVLDIRGYCKVGNDFADSIPLSSGKLRPLGRQVAQVPAWRVQTVQRVARSPDSTRRARA